MSPLVELATNFVRDAEAKYWVKLDYSKDSMAELDRALDEYLKKNKPTKWDSDLKGFASYAGEVLIKNLGGYWVQAGEGIEKIGVSGIGGFEITISPFDYLLKRLADPSKKFAAFYESIETYLKTNSDKLRPVKEIKDFTNQFISYASTFSFILKKDVEKSQNAILAEELDGTRHLRVLLNLTRNYRMLDELAAIASAEIDAIKKSHKYDALEIFGMVKRIHPVWKDVDKEALKEKLMKPHNAKIIELVDLAGKTVLLVELN